MNLHKNARTCPYSRALIIERMVMRGEPARVVGEDLGISERTVRKWIARYRAASWDGLVDRSSRAHRLAHQLGEDWVALIRWLREHYRMSARAIAAALGLARSTVSGVLKRLGISRLRDLEPRAPVVRYEYAEPGGLIHLDIKKLGRFHRAGHRVTGNRRIDSQGAGWEYVHVCVDDHSRVAYVEVLEDETQHSAVAFLRRAVRWFQRHGIRVLRVLTDNGSCYRSKLFNRLCAQLGIAHHYTRPYRPQTNGKAERFIGTMLREWAYGRCYDTSARRRETLYYWLLHYNCHRAHSSLGGQPPISRIPSMNNAHGIHN